MSDLADQANNIAEYFQESSSMDHPDVRPHLAKRIRLQHRKTVVLEQWWDTESEAASPELSKSPTPATPGSKRLWIPQDAKI